MKCFLRAVLACSLAVGAVSMATAQEVPKPVVRLGDWVEIGDDLFMNMIGSVDARFVTNHNEDFESDVRDRVLSRTPTASALFEGPGDFMQAEIRLGADARFQKNLTMQILFEAQSIWDGNLIDDRNNTISPGPDPQDFSQGPDIPASGENNGPHVERFWIDYNFPNTPLHLRVGADLWTTDQAGLVGDDDPRIVAYGKFGKMDAYAAAVIQGESARLGLSNDNDFIYYTFGVGYTTKPHRVQLDVAYFRDRFSGADGQPTQGQKVDSVLIQPSWTGKFNRLSGLLQGMLLWGTAEGTDIAGNPDYDVWSWGFVGQVAYDMGKIRPFAAVIFGSADDDPNDNDLKGFFTLPQREITLMSGRPQFNMLSESPALFRRSPAPAYAPGFDPEFRHTTGSIFSDRLGRTEHRDAAGNVSIDTSYSNVGTLVIPVGVQVFPAKGHDITAYYAYVAMVDSTLAESIAERNSAGRVTGIDESLIHEIGLTWEWQPSKYFAIALNGYADIPASGTKDIASVQNCNPDGEFRACEGEDIYLRGEAKFHARF